MGNILKMLLAASIKALTESEGEEKHEEKPCKENKFHLTNTTTKPLASLSGGYNGKDFIQSTANNVMVPGHVMIKGLKEPVNATYVFSSYRYKEGNIYEENVKILTEKGDIIAEAIYPDEGKDFLSTVEYADYDVHTSTGEMRETKGHKIRIRFDNTEPCKQRTISLVP